MIDENGFGNRLEELMIKSGYNNIRFTKELNVSKNAVGNYKKNQIPNAAILYEIAQLLGTTMEYLLTGKESKELTEQENHILKNYRNAAPGIQNAVNKLLDVPETKQEESLSSRTG